MSKKALFNWLGLVGAVFGIVNGWVLFVHYSGNDYGRYSLFAALTIATLGAILWWAILVSENLA